MVCSGYNILLCLFYVSINLMIYITLFIIVFIIKASSNSSLSWTKSLDRSILLHPFMSYLTYLFYRCELYINLHRKAFAGHHRYLASDMCKLSLKLSSIDATHKCSIMYLFLTLSFVVLPYIYLNILIFAKLILCM